MRKNVRKLIIMMLFIIILFNLFSVQVNGAYSKNINSKGAIKLASSSGTQTGQGYDDQMKGLIAKDWEEDSELNGKVTNVLTTIIVAIKIIAVAIAIIMLLVVAMKYMTSAPGDKAEIKKHAVVYVVGAFILFAVTGILSIIQEFATVFDTPSTAS